jgi:hypothetical protein
MTENNDSAVVLYICTRIYEYALNVLDKFRFGCKFEKRDGHTTPRFKKYFFVFTISPMLSIV